MFGTIGVLAAILFVFPVIAFINSASRSKPKSRSGKPPRRRV